MNAPLELALRVAADAAGAVARHPRVRALSAGRATHRGLRSLYFDTPSLDLARCGLGLRIERSGRVYIQTVEGRGGECAGLPQHVHHACRVPTESPMIDRISDLALRAALEREIAGAELEPVVETEIRRTRRLLDRGGAKLTLDVDVGEIRTRKGVLPISELRLAGESPEAVYALALELQQRFELRPVTASHADRGFGALTGERPTPRKAGRIALAEGATLEDALAAVLRSCLDQIVANEEPARDGLDPEGVHQLRVGVRRLRSAISLFRSMLPAELFAGLPDELRWLATELGEARDLDVFLADTLEPLARHFPDQPALKRFVDQAREMRAEAYRNVRRVLDSQRYARLMLTLASRVASRSWRDQPVSEEAALLFAEARDAGRPLLARRHAKALRLGRHISQRNLAEIHRLRIQLKKLRYASEFLRGAYPAQGAGRFIARLSGLQDVLGHLNDVINAERNLEVILQRMGPEVSAEHRLAAGFIAGWTAHDRETRLARLRKRWKTFRKTRPFWERA